MANVTMKDIAVIAGVSLKTVSRVVNNSSSVKKETRKKVLKIIKEENYQVNVLAKGLRTKSTNTIIIFVDKHDGGYWNAWHNEAMHYLLTNSKKIGYKVVISPSSASGYLSDETDGFWLLKNGFADGAIIFDTKESDIRIKYLKNNNIPYVIIGKDMDSNNNYVDLDNIEVGYLGAKYLINKNYQNILFLLGSRDFIVNQDRASGFNKACSEKNIAGEVIFGIDKIELAYEETKELIKNKKVDAFFVSGDERAMGVYRAINELGLSIPDDIAVLGIDNIKYAQFLTPSLSSIDQRLDLFTNEAIDMLVKLISKKETKIEAKIIEPKLISRNSS